MKRGIFSLVTAAVFLAAIVSSCSKSEDKDDEPKTIAVTGVSLNNATLSLVVDGQSTLTATVAPADATNKTVSWASSAPAVAEVNNGNVTAKAAGQATITVTTADGGKTAQCVVTVTTSAVAVTGVTLNESTLELTVGGDFTLAATVAPADATNKDVTWASSTPAVAEVNATGKVTAKAAGQATITVTTADGGKTAQCVVTVAAAGPVAASSQTWTIISDDQTIKQEWTDYIVYDGAGKVAAGTIANFSSTGTTADYRNNPGYRGYMYNWYYVKAHEAELCPAPWRVPSKADIVNMDLAMGGTGESQENVPGQVQKYESKGFIYSGRAMTDNTFAYLGRIGYILTNEQADNDANYPSHFCIKNGTQGDAYPVVYPKNEYHTGTNTKNVGFPVRCVRDISD